MTNRFVIITDNVHQHCELLVRVRFNVANELMGESTVALLNIEPLGTIICGDTT
jgi:hypothetical protein